MLPAYAANMAPVIFKDRFKRFAVPIDNGAMFRGKPLFGSHKTVRGLIIGILVAVIIAGLQFLLYKSPFFQKLSFTDYAKWALFGFLMGSGALIGDLFKSFIKRRVGIRPGARFIPFDQIDFVIGALLFSLLAVGITWAIALTCIALSFVLHIGTNHLAFWLKIRNEKW